MSDKKKNDQNPRFTPVVEDVELPTADPAAKRTELPPVKEDRIPQQPQPAPKPRFTPVVEDADLPEADPKPQKVGLSPEKEHGSPERVNPAPKQADFAPKQAEFVKKAADPAEKTADSLIKRQKPQHKEEKKEESGAEPAPGNATASKEAAITESGMIRKDDEIDRALFDPEEKADPDLIGFSPDTEVSPAALVGQTRDAALSFDDLEAKEPEKDGEIIHKVKIRKKPERGASLRTLAFGLCYLVVVILLGILLGTQVVGIGNDIFSFTFETDAEGNPITYTVVIGDEGMSPAEVGRLLKDAGAIKYDWVFKLYAQLKKKDHFKVTAGTYTISAAANYDAIMSLLNPVPPREEITITFTEGMNTDEIINLFLENGIGTREGFEKALNSFPYSYWFMDYLTGDLPEGRFYRLDGYLYPDTYRFFSDTSEIAAIDKLLENFNRKFGEEYKTACDELAMTPDEIVRLASMIEAEVKHAVDYITVSSVFHNRMKSASFDGLLQSDATVQYYFYHTEGARHEEITPEDLQTDTPYNTYLNKGLPPGAICSPSLTSLRAALYPEPDCPYYYFVSRPNGYMYYAKTLAEHNANIEKVRKESEDTSGGVGEYE